MDVKKYENLMKKSIVIDGRNCYNLYMREHTNIIYDSIGRKSYKLRKVINMKYKKAKFIFILFVIVAILIVSILYYKNVEKQKQLLQEEKYTQENLAQIGRTEDNYFSQIYNVMYDEINEEEQIEQEQKYEEIQSHIDENTGVKYITYEDFGAKSDESFDNYQVIKEAHDYANKNNYEVRATSQVYHIYKLEDLDPIIIKTNTDWNNAQFIIHDENINDLKTKDYVIFQIKSNEKNQIITDPNILNSIEINTNTKNIKQLAGYGECLCVVYNDQKMQYIRSGSNENSGAYQRDLFKIDNDGNVLNDIQWDFEHVSQITIIPIPEDTLNVKNGNFRTNLPQTLYEQNSGYFNRNISCTRSNTIIENVNHTVNNNDYIGGPYFGFIKLSYVANVELKDSVLYSHKYKAKSNYDLIIECSTNVTINNVSSNDIEDINRWGITGTNYTKDITYNNCSLNRIDAHCGVYNLNILNSTIGAKGITVVGAGLLNIYNVRSLCNIALVELRSDYGSTWNGKIVINDCEIKTTSKRLISFYASYDDGKPHDFGYDLYLPNIDINNLKIDNSQKLQDLYLFYNNNSSTGNENGDMTDVYNLFDSVIIRNYSIASSKKLKLFYNKFYNNLEDLGISLSMPLSDVQEVQVTYANRDVEVENDIITNNDVKIVKPYIEGIQTILKINDTEIQQEEFIIKNEDFYEIKVFYKNLIEQTDIKTSSIIIDKTSPRIIGVGNRKIYTQKVTPLIKDENLNEVIVSLNGQILEDYSNGNTNLEKEGIYQVIASDVAGNISNIIFEIFGTVSTEYKIDNEIIKNIEPYTNKEMLKKELSIKSNFKILRNNVEISKENIATGDILLLESGDKYTLIVNGDINKDSEVNIKDLVLLRKNIIGDNSLDDIQKLSSDLNIDNAINIKDIVKVRQLILRKSN